MSSFTVLFPIIALEALAGLTLNPALLLLWFALHLLICGALLFWAPHLGRSLFLGLLVFSMALVQKQAFQKQLDELPKETILMVGEIADLQLRFDGARKGIFHLHGFYLDHKFQPAAGKFALLLKKGAAHQAVKAKSKVVIRGRIDPFQPADLPWGFNEWEFGLSRHLLGRIKIHHPKHLLQLKAQTSPSTMTLWRHRLRESMLQLASPREAGLILALMIGDTALFEPAQRSIYQNVGAGHLLAVSGLQVTLFALILYFLFLRLPLLWRCSPATGWQYGFWITLVLIMIWTYVALCAWPPSAIRAAMMTTHYLLAATWGRPQSLSHILCTSGSLALLWQPTQIIDPSFLLSYAALFGLLIFTAKASAVHPALGLLRTWTLGSLGSTLATFPFVAHFFGVFIPAGFVVNIFLIPVASFIQVPSLFLAGLGVAFSVPAFCHWGGRHCGFVRSHL